MIDLKEINKKSRKLRRDIEKWSKNNMAKDEKDLREFLDICAELWEKIQQSKSMMDQCPLPENKTIRKIKKDLELAEERVDNLSSHAVRELEKYDEANPQLPGIPVDLVLDPNQRN